MGAIPGAVSNMGVCLFFYALPYVLTMFLAGACVVLIWRNYGLRRHYQLLEDSIDVSASGMVFFDEKGRFYNANKQALKYAPFLEKKTGNDLSIDGALNYLFDHAMDCDESLEKAIESVAGKMSAHGFREVIEWGDGNICLAEVQKAKDKSSIIILNDISDLREHQKDFLRLNRYSHELGHAVEAAAIGIVISDPKQPGNAIIYANESFCRISGMQRGQIIGNDWESLFEFIDDSEIFLQPIVAAIGNNKKIDTEAEITEAQDTRWFNIKVVPALDGNGNPDLFIGIFTDITAQKQREAEEFQGKKLDALGKLAAGVAHDFNNVLSIVDGYIRMAENEIEENSKVWNYLQNSRKATKRGADLTRRMLMFSRHKIVSGNVVDLCEAVRDQELLLQPLLDASINCIIRTDTQGVFIECSPDVIGQILMNLAVNARDAMTDGGTFSVEVKIAEKKDLPGTIPEPLRNHSFACIDITDTGAGMDKKTMDRIFDPFFTTKDQGRGTGLGLSMVYGLVQECGGYIGVRSLPGQGTTISIYFPVTDKKPTRRIRGDDQDIGGLRLEGYTAMVAEDEPDLRMLVCDMLEKLGMKVLQAENGNEALVKQEEFDGKIDVLLTDVVMPELNGVRLAELFHAMREETKIIFMSGYPANGSMTRVELPEDADYMAKPLEYGALARLIYQRLREDECSGHGKNIQSARWRAGGAATGDRQA